VKREPDPTIAARRRRERERLSLYEGKKVVAVCETFRQNVLFGDGSLARPDAPAMLCRLPGCPVHGGKKQGSEIG
jgi:hypothetical protein